jgi:hypothetical protein
LFFKSKKYILFSILTLNLFSSYIPSYASKYFSDIPQGHWAENIADLLYEETIMGGVSSNEFGGSLKLTRYDTVRILNGLIGKKYITQGFILLSDVKGGHPDFKNIMRVISAGLIDYDRNNNKFDGDKKISRYDFAVSLIKTLNFLQAEPISIRIPPKKIAASSDKKEFIDKAVNYWQITEGFYDWSENINRYEALEMVAKATKIVRQDLFEKIGEVKGNIESTPTPISTPIVVKTPIPNPTPIVNPYSTPTPISTPIVVKTPIPNPTPIVNPYSTPTPISTPIVIKTPIPNPTPIVNPYSTPTPMPTPIVVKTPIPNPTPTPRSTVEPTPSSIPTSEPTPIIQETPVTISKPKILRNQFTLKGSYNLNYSEEIPSIFSVVETVKQKNDSLGVSILGELSYWLSGNNNLILDNIGLTSIISSLGSYVHPAQKPDTEISETFKINIAVLYKIIKSNDLELAIGPNIFYRDTGRNSTLQGAPNSYWRASKNYLGFGIKTLLGYKIMDKLFLDSYLSLQYVSQTIKETIRFDTGQNVPSGAIDRFNIDLSSNIRYDLLEFGNNKFYLNLGLDGNILLGDGNQMIFNLGGGSGISF